MDSKRILRRSYRYNAGGALFRGGGSGKPFIEVEIDRLKFGKF
jgi:hypothetical protein